MKIDTLCTARLALLAFVSLASVAQAQVQARFAEPVTARTAGEVTARFAESPPVVAPPAQPAASANPAMPRPARPQPAASVSHVGMWYATSSANGANPTGTLELTADGRYLRKAGSRQSTGRYSLHGNEIHFDGDLSAWDGGRATLAGGVMRFAWKDQNIVLEFKFLKG